MSSSTSNLPELKNLHLRQRSCTRWAAIRLATEGRLFTRSCVSMVIIKYDTFHMLPFDAVTVLCDVLTPNTAPAKFFVFYRFNSKLRGQIMKTKPTMFVMFGVFNVHIG